MKKIIICIFIVFFLMGINLLFAQEQKRLTQKEFAVQLVKEMGFNYLLPLAPNSLDCVELLENLGVSPMRGWKPNEYLSDDAYTVIIAKAVGKEEVVHQQAALVCQKNIAVINKRWQSKPSMTLDELINSPNVFPKEKPICPFGIKHQDKNGDHKVDTHYHPTSFLARLRLPSK